MIEINVTKVFFFVLIFIGPLQGYYHLCFRLIFILISVMAVMAKDGTLSL